MTIITFQNQDCKISKQVPMTKDMLVKDLFTNITKSTLRGKAYSNLLDALKRNLRYRSCQTKYNRNVDVVSDACLSKSKSSYHDAMSHLNKLGIILSHRGTLYLNPLVETRTSAKFYELVIEYYNLLWSEEFRSSVYIKYKDFSFTLSSTEYVKQLIAEDHKELLQCDENLQHLTSEQLYDLAFTHSKNHLESDELRNAWGVDEGHLLTALKSKMAKTYTNLGYAIMKTIAVTHFDILCEQLPLVQLDNNEVAFGRLPSKWKCIRFSETSTYSRAIELYNLSNKQEDLQQQFEEEDSTATAIADSSEEIIMTEQDPQNAIPNINPTEYSLDCLREAVWYDNEDHKQRLYKLWLHNGCQHTYHPHFSSELHIEFKRMYVQEKRSSPESRQQLEESIKFMEQVSENNKIRLAKQGTYY